MRDQVEEHACALHVAEELEAEPLAGVRTLEDYARSGPYFGCTVGRVANRIVDAVSLKVPKLGGLRNAVAAARICEAGRVRCRFGAHVGPRLMSAQAAHLAQARGRNQWQRRLPDAGRRLSRPGPQN